MKIEELADRMLKENTGASFLDSGGAYGRHWEKNQGKNFKDDPEVTADFYEGESIIPYASLYHWLVEMFELDEVCNEFNSMEVEDWDSEIWGVSKEGLQWLKDKGFRSVWRENSYNVESDLSQIVIMTHLVNEDLESAEYFLIQVHGGCDARGGYTDAKLIKAYDSDYIRFTGNVMAVVTRGDEKIFCDNMYNGYCLTDEDGNEIIYQEGDKVDMWIFEF